ncbi:MAG TPA: hypothetical protein VFX02_05985 [Gammaproteobacteria bacterium]|nr:hypothetical protein [Gammaproteobacteria bacterium]
MKQVLGKSSKDVLAVPNIGGRALTTAERRELDLSAKIQGWGSDLDGGVRPGVPMDKAPDLGAEVLYPPIEQQVPRNKVHKSTEHGRLTPVFGNACPPRGLSGLVRDFAYGISEGRMSHWLLLMLADRVDMVEELLLDISRLRIPNIPREMGIEAALRYNRAGVVKKTAIGLGALAVIALCRTRGKRSL